MRLLSAAIVVAAISASPALAASTGACKTQGSAAAHALLELPQGDTALDRAIAAATQPATLAKVKAESHCKRGSDLGGDNADAYPRIFIQNGGLDVAFLAPVATQGKQLYVLIKTWGSGAVRVDGLFDAIPDDARLIKAMRGFADGGYDPLKVDDHGHLVDTSNTIPLLLAATAKRMG